MWSLQSFIRVAHDLFPASRDFRSRRKRLQAKSGGPEKVMPDWLPFDGGDPYVIGGRNDPKTFVFEFLRDPYPYPEGPPTIYEEIRLYKQLCKDYKWKGAQEAIDWVTDVRKHDYWQENSGMMASEPTTTLSLSSPFDDPLWRADALSLIHKRYPPTDLEATDYDSDHEDEFVRPSFPRLTPEFFKFATDALSQILTPAPFGDVEPAITALVDRGVKLICFPSHSTTTMQHLRPVLPAAFHKHVELAPLTTPVHFAAGKRPWWKIYGKCKEVAPDVEEEILIVSAGVGRVLLPALGRGYVTALLKRPDSLESHVDFVVEERPEHNPVPLMTVPGLMELCAALEML